METFDNNEKEEIMKFRNSCIQDVNWMDLTFGDMMLLVDKWSIVSIFANIFQIVGSLFFLTKISKNTRAPDIILGIGCSFAWFNITRYLMKLPNYKTMINSFVKSFP